MENSENLTYQVLQEIALLPAGAQSWNIQVCDTNEKGNFAYASTLAIYIYEKDGNSYRLHSVIHEHKEVISCLAWHPQSPNLIASYSANPGLIIYDVNFRIIVSKLSFNNDPAIRFLSWPSNSKFLIYVNEFGPVLQWNYANDVNSTSIWLEEVFYSLITCFNLHPKDSLRIAFGHSDGTISFRNSKKFMKHYVFSNGDKTKVKSVAWDPFSTSYLLVLYGHCALKLLDVESSSVINTYTMPSSAISLKQVSWLPSSPGVFMTADEQNGNIRVWLVSRSSSCEILKLKDEGFHLFELSKLCHSQFSGVPTSGECVYEAEIVSIFSDGGIGVYSTKQKNWLYLQKAGHKETIFDCKWNPDNCEILATCSYDGSIRLWELDESFALKPTSYHDDNAPVYSISWAPKDLNCLACASGSKGVFIWNIKKSSIVQRLQDHGDNVVYTVAWNPEDSRKIASGGKSCFCIVHHADGSIFARLAHPDTVYGCDWKNASILATACGDGIIRLFDMEKKKSCLLLKGHASKVFRVQWNRTCPDLLCSSSDDHSIRVWDTVQGTCVCVLAGHDNKVRAVIWCPSAPYFIISGSWDSTIRVWDIRDKSCRDVAKDHRSDIYGLSVHPEKPFLIASTSRDTTIRLWSFAPQFTSIFLDVLVKLEPPPPPAIINPSSILDMGYEYYLCGDTYSHALNSASHEARLRSLLFLFKPFRVTSNIWDLVCISQGETCLSRLSTNYSQGILHSQHVKKMLISESQEICSTLSDCEIPRSPQERSQMELLAHSYLKAGQMKNYCEVLVKLGAWQQAISLAPTVSYQYWTDLVKRYSVHLAEQDSPDAVVYNLAVGDIETAVNFLTVRGEYKDALTYAVTAKHKCPSYEEVHREEVSDHSDRGILVDITSKLASQLISKGNSLAACCSFLAIDELKKALKCLLLGNELEVVTCLGIITKQQSPEFEEAVYYLTKRCEGLNKWELGIKLANLVEDRSVCESLKIELCSRYPGSQEERQNLYNLANLPTVEEAARLAAENLEAGLVVEAIKYYMLATDWETGIGVGMTALKDNLEKPELDLDAVKEILRWTQCISKSLLADSQVVEGILPNRLELFAISSYIGALDAMRRGFDDIVPALFRTTINILSTNPGVTLGLLTIEKIKAILKVWTSHTDGTSKLNRESLLSDIGCLNLDFSDSLLIGQVRVLGSDLPTFNNVMHCWLTEKPIQGPAFYLEDGASVISLNAAIMWNRVNPFSPVHGAYLYAH